MNDRHTEGRWRPTRTNLVAGALAVAGFALLSVSWAFVMLIGLGFFGPGILRELGLLHDKDEFQRRADHRAGYHAFLTAGIAACGLVAWLRGTGSTVRNPDELGTLFLAVLGFTWLFSSLMAYWGARKTAVRVLLAFGCAWFVFAVVANTGPEWTGWGALLLTPLLTAPFFVLAWLSHRHPRLAGGLLLVAFVAMMVLFRVGWNDNLSLVTQGVTFVLLLCPLLASGIALLVDRSGATSTTSTRASRPDPRTGPTQEDRPVPTGPAVAGLTPVRPPGYPGSDPRIAKDRRSTWGSLSFPQACLRRAACSCARSRTGPSSSESGRRPSSRSRKRLASPRRSASRPATPCSVRGATTPPRCCTTSMGTARPTSSSATSWARSPSRAAAARPGPCASAPRSRSRTGGGSSSSSTTGDASAWVHSSWTSMATATSTT
ncbi:MAG: hypothetical protein R3F30_07180 [Planctomycetota bacterium]